MNFERYLKYLTMSKRILCNFSCRNVDWGRWITTALKYMEMNSCAPSNAEIMIHYMDSHIILYEPIISIIMGWMNEKEGGETNACIQQIYIYMYLNHHTHEKSSMKRDQCLIWARISFNVCAIALNSTQISRTSTMHTTRTKQFQLNELMDKMLGENENHFDDVTFRIVRQFWVWQILNAWWANN